ncbi:helix-turn-helix domain-containing protein [Allobaculum sp. Allo2]|nr:helix-turn-helix domain-containing protein [Allobaculum sp. Allo2]
MRDLLGISYSAIGKEIGGRDHTTISSSCSRVRKLIDSDPAWKEAVDTLRKKISG